MPAIRPARALRSLLPVLLMAGTTACAVAQPAEQPAPAPVSFAPGDEAPSVTQHSITVDGERLDYTATVGFTDMLDDDGALRGRIFSIAYTLDNAQDAPADRPVTFVFNGGPGSSSVWLHLGTAGPMRVDLGPDGDMPRPPGALVKNHATWLDVTDLVFIDPVGTGYSRPAGDGAQREFSGLEEDIRAVGDFIRLWTTRSGRWMSPKFLAGESYGTTRAAGLSQYLQNRHGMYLSGIAMISTILNFQTARFDTGNDLPYVLFLPTYAAIAHFHGQLPPDMQSKSLERVAEEARAWAIDEYMPALAKDAALTDAERSRVVRDLARFTGLDEDYLHAANMRVVISAFCKELLRDERRTVGRLDGRFVGIDSDASGDSFEHDPSMTAIRGPYTAAFNDYIRRDLGFESDTVYEILSGRVGRWSYAGFENEYADLGERLRDAMSRNRFLHVLFASGYYDLATPYFASDYTVNTLGLEPELRDNIHQTYYPSGHMMYIHVPSLERLHDDMRTLIETAVSATDPSPGIRAE
ncbi:MAG: S10 family peptidase [Phycisphaerales bacterium]